MNKILVLGSDGQVGNELKKIAPRNYIFLSKKKIDINFINKIKKTIKRVKPKVIINLAAFTNVDQSEVNKLHCLKTNYLSNVNLINFIKKKNILFFFISSDYIFDGNKNNKYSEFDKKNPINFYGLTKSLSENYIIKNSSNYIILRTSWVYSNSRSSFIYKIIEKLKKNEVIYGVNNTLSSPTSAYNLSLAILFIIKKKIKNKILHFTDNKKLSPYQLIVLIKKVYSKSKSKIKKINYLDLATEVARPKYSYLGTSKILRKVKSLSTLREIKRYVRII